MNKEQLIAEIAKKTGTSLAATERYLNAMTEIIGKTLKKGANHVRITNFGTFRSKFQEGRTGVNPLKKEETIQIPSTYRIYFTPGVGLKNTVNNNKNPKKEVKKGTKQNKE